MNTCKVFGVGAVAALLAVAAPARADAPDEGAWSFELGAGAFLGPDYEGSDDYEVRPVPIVEIDWNDRVFLSARRGVGVYALRDREASVGGAVGWQFGRDEDDNEALAGLGDVDGSPVARLFGDYAPGAFGVGLEIVQDLGDGHEGATVTADAFWRRAPTDGGLVLRLGPSVTWASEDYMTSFFGIDAAQAARSAYTPYAAEAGLKEASVSALAAYPLTDRLWLGGRASLGRLLGDAADSPIVDREGSARQASVGLTLNYRFRADGWDFWPVP